VFFFNQWHRRRVEFGSFVRHAFMSFISSILTLIVGKWQHPQSWRTRAILTTKTLVLRDLQ